MATTTKSDRKSMMDINSETTKGTTFKSTGSNKSDNAKDSKK